MFKVFFLILCSLIPSISMAKSSITVRVTDFKPHYYKDRNGEWHGMAVEFAQLVIKEAGLKPVYEKIPWERALYSLKIGDVDLMMNLSKTENRKQFLYFLGPHLDETIILVVKKGFTGKINSLNDLKKLPEGIGVERGNYYGMSFEKKRKTDPDFAAKIQEVTSTEQNYRKLQSGRINGFLTSKCSISYKMNHFKGFKDFRIYPLVVNRNPVYMGISKTSVSKALYLRLKKAFEKIRDDGRLDKLIKSYL